MNAVFIKLVFNRHFAHLPHPLPVGISISTGSYGSTALTMTLPGIATGREGEPNSYGGQWLFKIASAQFTLPWRFLAGDY